MLDACEIGSDKLRFRNEKLSRKIFYSLRVANVNQIYRASNCSISLRIDHGTREDETTICGQSVSRVFAERSSRLERKGKKRSPLNPFNRPQTRTNRQVSKNRRLTGGTTPCPRRDKGARAIRLVGKDQKEGRKEEVKILFFPYRTVLSVFRAATLPTGGEPIHLWATCAASFFPPLANERNRGEGGKREGTVPLASPPSLVGRARLSIKFRGTGNIFRSSHAR